MRRFFIDDLLDNKEQFIFPEEESKHIVKVLRMKEGDELEIFNGKGMVVAVTISSIFGKKVVVQKKEIQTFPQDDYHIHIAIAPTKLNDRFEWFLEKSVEIGIHEITPILCTHSERKKINWERYQKIVIAATKQSKRIFLPQLNELTAFHEFIKKYPTGWIAHCYDFPKTTILADLKEKNSTFFKQNHPILIGPEGDFTVDEVKKAVKIGYKTISLGSHRLRTETAGVVACMNMKLFFEEILK